MHDWYIERRIYIDFVHDVVCSASAERDLSTRYQIRKYEPYPERKRKIKTEVGCHPKTGCRPYAHQVAMMTNFAHISVLISFSAYCSTERWETLQ